jgi:hypothetical protein
MLYSGRRQRGALYGAKRGHDVGINAVSPPVLRWASSQATYSSTQSWTVYEPTSASPRSRRARPANHARAASCAGAKDRTCRASGSAMSKPVNGSCGRGRRGGVGLPCLRTQIERFGVKGLALFSPYLCAQCDVYCSTRTRPLASTKLSDAEDRAA